MRLVVSGCSFWSYIFLDQRKSFKKNQPDTKAETQKREIRKEGWMDGTFGNEVCVHLLPIKEAPCLMQTAETLTMVRSVQCMPNRWRNGLAWPSTAWCPLSWHWQIDSEIDLRLAKVPAQVQMGSMQDWGMFLMTWLKSYPNVKLWRLLGECHVVQSLWKSSSPMSWKPMSPNRWPTGLSTHCVMKTLKKSSQPQWLNSWKKGYHAENQAHSKRQNSSQSTPSIKSTDTRGSQSIIKSMNSSHIPTVRLGDPDGLRRGWWTPMDMTQPEAVNWIHHFRTRTTHVNVIYSL